MDRIGRVVIEKKSYFWQLFLRVFRKVLKSQTVFAYSQRSVMPIINLSLHRPGRKQHFKWSR